jgi:arylsulfatase A-like enzyme
MRGSFDDASAESPRKTQFYAMLGSRSIWHEGWKAVTTHPCLAGWANFDEWELYHTDVDRSEVHNLASEQPDRLRELINIWF